MAKLKIQKTNQTTGFTSNVVDSYTGPETINSNYLGGVGGFTDQTVATIQPSVKVRGETATTGSIIFQKGMRKFLVSDENTSQDEDIVQGQEYRISLVSGTNWQQFGAGPNANTNDVFTAAINGSAAVVDNGQVQNVATCTLVNALASELTTANTMTIRTTVASFAGANVANIGTGGGGYTDNRAYAYVTWTAANVTGYATPTVGYQVVGTSLTGNVTIVAVNSATNVTVSCATQTVSAEQATVTETFAASRITNRYVWDWANTKWRYWFAAPYTDNTAVLSSQPAWQANVFVQVASA